MTSDLIIQFKEGDNKSLLSLISKFNPLLKKYSYKLYYDDAYNDLIVDFIELIRNIEFDNFNNKSEGSLVSYICKSIRSSYVRRLVTIKKNRSIVNYSDLSEKEIFHVETVLSTLDEHFIFEFTDISNMLTESELFVIKMIYLSGYNISEIACFLGVTRQEVNQMKKRALKKLKKQLLDKL